MKNDFLLSAFTDIRDDFIMEAEETMKNSKKKLPWKALLIAALIPIVTVGMVVNLLAESKESR